MTQKNVLDESTVVLDSGKLNNEFKSEDSLEEKYGGEYSEGTLEMMREIGRPLGHETETPLEPLEEAAACISSGLPLPPQAHDALLDEAQREIGALETVRDSRPASDAVATAAYRAALVDGTAPEDLKWLKLKAYHRGMQQLESHKAGAGQQQRYEQYDVPVDRVPPELLDLTPQQILERRSAAVAVSSSAAAAQALASVPISEESEWVPGWDSKTAADDPNTMASLRHAWDAARLELEQRKAWEEQEQARLQQWQRQDEEVLQQPIESPKYKAYTPEYLQELELKRKVKRQQRQASLAFWISFVGVVGVYVTRAARQALARRAARQRRAQQQAAAAAGGAEQAH